MSARLIALGAALVATAASGCASPPPAAPSPAPAAGGGAAGAFTRVVAPFTVRDADGTPYEHPFLGGFDVPRPQLVDIDGDGDRDLFVQERSNELMYLENIGTRGAPRYQWRSDRYAGLAVGEWTRFTDVDGDGDQDLLAEQPFSYVRLYRNDGGRTAARWTLAADSLRDGEGKAIFADRQNIPNVADIDCDSLPDLFLGRVEGTITRYEAESRDGAGVPRFRFVTDRFEGIEIIGQLGSMHGANTMAIADADGDGDHDLFWGDFFEPGLLLITNQGSCTSPDLRGQPVRIEADGATFRTSGYNAPALDDLDADGDADMLVGVLGGAFDPNRTAVENLLVLARTSATQYSVRTRRALTMLDVGSESAPALADLDGDGDLDLVVGSKLDPHVLERARLYVFRNEGSRTAPAFRLSDSLDFGPGYHYAPAVADLDGDGRPELLVGTWNDGIRVYRDAGAPAAARWAADTAATLRLPRGSHATPALADVDGDGDLDLVAGEASGELNLWRNDGTRTAPRWVLASEAWLGVDAGRRSAPAFADVDGDGDQDLLVGREEGGLLLWRNTGSARAPTFTADPSFTVSLPMLSTPAPGDLDGDGRPELLAGNMSGGIVYLAPRSR